MLSTMIAMVLFAAPEPNSPLFMTGNSQESVRIAQGQSPARRPYEGRFEHPDFKDMIGFYDNGPHHGTVAPDFELQSLGLYEFGIEREGITEGNASDLYKPVRLSDFRGHKPVVLIFGSYT